MLSINSQIMSLSRQTAFKPEAAAALVVGMVECWPSASQVEMHAHERHQLMYSTKGVMHVTTAGRRWILPPTRAIWISAGTAHAFSAKRPVDVTILYIDQRAKGVPNWSGCEVLNVSPLVRELISACAVQSWEHGPHSPQGRLSQVLLDQLDALPHASLDLPQPRDARAVRVADLLRDTPADRRSVSALASVAGASARTIERLFASETGMSFGAWRLKQRMIVALELLAHGESVGNVAFAVGYESASSFVATFRAMFGTTPARYFALHGQTGTAR
ncbi:AraC family transcriptional regulator [Serratia nevei]|uniref:AraC family transcriptional regulator n=1 Tax=Serratia nevei TaxID=2703794 RepID=UPI003FA6ABED